MVAAHLRFFSATLLALAVSVSGCGGEGGGGQGFGLPKDYRTPILVSESLRFAALETSGPHTCGVSLDGSTWCWGRNGAGELGTSDALDMCDIPGIVVVACTGTPQRVANAPVFSVLAAGAGGDGYTCGLTNVGAAWCWGFGKGGQLGDGQRDNSMTPVAVAGGLAFAAIRAAVHGSVTCGLTSTGEAWCWGPGVSALGGGAGTSTPVRMEWGRSFVALDVGEMHACGLTADGRAWCWGNNWYGQLGVGSAGGSGGLASSSTPLPVLGDRVFRSIATGSDHTCALDEGGAAWCWGAADTVGSPTAVPDYVGTPQAVSGGHVFKTLTSAALHTCGLSAQGEAWCWGRNYGGELGNDTATPSQIPVRVAAAARFDRLAQRATCALTTDGQAWCWGSNTFGNVGRRSHWAQ